MMKSWIAAGCLVFGLALAGSASAQEVVNIYSGRHYDTDERLYSDFEKATGIKVNRIEDEPAALIARIKAEGPASPADVYLITDAGRLWTAEKEGLLRPVESEILEARIPPEYRHPQKLWFGFSRRARIIFYDKTRIDPAGLTSYASLADPKHKGLVCTRSSNNVYMVSMLAAMIAHLGPEKAEAWAKGMWDNRARDPAGSDTDQLASVASGECGIAVANTYYFARALRSGKTPGLDKKALDRIGWVFPDQDGNGAHVNISGAGVLKYAPDKANAIKFLEYLASDSAQHYFASGNDEYPVVPGVAIDAVVASLGTFKPDTLNLSELGKNQDKAIEIYARIGYK